MLTLSRRAALASGAVAPFVSSAEAQANFGSAVAGLVGILLPGILIYQWINGDFRRGKDTPVRHVRYSVLGAHPLPPPDPNEPENPLLQTLAARFGGNKEVGGCLLRELGDGRTKDFISGNLGLWTQRFRTDDPNMLVVRMQNNSPNTVRYQLEYKIEQWPAKVAEYPSLLDNGYKFGGYASAERHIALRLQFKTPGLRRVSLINTPDSIFVPPAFVYVLPFTIQQTA